VPLRADLVYRGDFREGGGYDGMRTLLALPRRPTAVLVANNLMTLGAFRALHEARVRIPDEVALVGFDDMPWATSLNPPLTAISQPSQEIGSAAADLLLGRIAHPERAFRRYRDHPSSCGPRAAPVRTTHHLARGAPPSRR
jgi:DNA-binding LacI/PurR family transcriptional regulator